MKSFVVICAAATMLIGCESSTGVDLSAQRVLAEHQAQWDNRDFGQYTFDYTLLVFGVTYRKRITVANNAVTSVVDIGSDLPDVARPDWPTIDDIFATVRQDLSLKGGGVVVHYDPQLGFPTYVSTAELTINPGGGMSASVSNLQSPAFEMPVSGD